MLLKHGAFIFNGWFEDFAARGVLRQGRAFCLNSPSRMLVNWRDILAAATVGQIQQLIDVITPASDLNMAGKPRHDHGYGVNGHKLHTEDIIDSIVAGDPARILEFARKVTTLRGEPWIILVEQARESDHPELNAWAEVAEI
ncbi:hypothetical protein H9P43_006853 [Blastocladiella emersonii ATCC 22665]|nr:hypothetical protein H9P43_006853 [Blastocladiella emersonii ATCC 22665]